MEKLTYSAATKKKFKASGWQSRKNAVFGMRSIKMLRPICNTCQGDPDHPRNWYDNCTHFGEKKDLMYWRREPKVTKIPTYEEDEEGDLVVKEVETRTKLVLVPNWTEVPADTSHSDGKAPEKCHDEKGFRFPEEVGLAPMCQSWGCGQTWPTIRTQMGDYCSELHAKLCVANEMEINLVAQNQRLRNQQLQEIAL